MSPCLHTASTMFVRWYMLQVMSCSLPSPHFLLQSFWYKFILVSSVQRILFQYWAERNTDLYRKTQYPPKMPGQKQELSFINLQYIFGYHFFGKLHFHFYFSWQKCFVFFNSSFLPVLQCYLCFVPSCELCFLIHEDFSCLWTLTITHLPRPEHSCLGWKIWRGRTEFCKHTLQMPLWYFRNFQCWWANQCFQTS